MKNIATVYDIQNCGPRNRFWANGRIVHNSDRINAQNFTRNAPAFLDKEKTLPHPDGDMRPGAVRRALTAPEGQVVLVRDSSQIEARLLAAIAGQTDVIQTFATNGDVYRAFAARLYNKPPQEITPFERSVGKICVLGLGYQMGATKFQDTLESGPMGMDPIFLPFEECQRIVNVYRSANYAIVNFWSVCNNFLHSMLNPTCDFAWKMLRIQHQKIILPSGLSLQYPGLEFHEDTGSFTYNPKNNARSAADADEDDDGEDAELKNIYGGKIAENIVQALAQDIVKHAMRTSAPLLREVNYMINLQVHDEIIAIGPEENVEHADRILESTMCNPPDWVKQHIVLPLASEGGYARNYIK